MKISSVVFVLTALFFGSCTHYQSPGDLLQRAVSDYNEGIRWQNWKVAAEYVPRSERADFLARKEGQSGAMHVTDFEIRDVTHDSEKGEASVVVDFGWHRYPSLTVHSTRVRQQWRYIKSRWVLEGQEEIKPEKEEMTPDKMF